MLRFAIGQSEQTNTAAAVADLLEQCAEQLGEHLPQAGILICSALHDYQLALDTLTSHFPGLALIGSTTRGVMTAHAGYSGESMSLLLIVSDTVRVRAGLGRAVSTAPDAAVRQALEQARQGSTQPETLCFAIVDSMGYEIRPALRTLGASLAQDCTLIGFSASMPEDQALSAIRQFAGTELLRDGLSVLLFFGPLECTVQVERGWRPVGEPHLAQGAGDNVVTHIGGRTAVEFYSHYLGAHSRPAAYFPLAVFDDSSQSYALRIPLGYDLETGSIRYSGAVPAGARVQLTEAVRDHMLAQPEQATAAARASMTRAEPALCLLISCSLRRYILGTRTGDELTSASRSVPSIPIFGMYASGELAPLAPGAPSSMHNATIAVVILGERGAAQAAPAWTPPARRTSGAATADLALLARKLARSEAQRAELENLRERNVALLRTIGAEISENRRLIAVKNQELERLYAELEQEKRKSDELLLNILPRDVAEELKRTGRVEPVHYQAVTVLFTDFQGFTQIAAHLPPDELLRELDYHFSAFDTICERHGLEKLKTIGDAYMCAAGIPQPRSSHALDTVRAALDMQAFMDASTAERRAQNRPYWQLRIGIHTGPLMAGVIGNKKFAYDIWGDTVNLAARTESSGTPGRINITYATYEAVRKHFACEHRGKIAIKNAGEIDMYYVIGATRTSIGRP